MKFKYPSPADIEEMKARGYERETIDRALEQSKRWHEADSIRASIRKAFAGIKLGNGVGLYQAQGIDGYEDAEACATYRANDEKEDWSRISVEALNECNSSLSFFDDEGMRFHLPAYLLEDLSRNSVMPAKAGIQNRPIGRCFFKPWIPAFAGMTM